MFLQKYIVWWSEIGQGGVKYENKENNHVVYFPLVLQSVLSVIAELEKKPVKVKVQEIIWGTPRRPPCMPNSEITIKDFVYTN